MKINKLIYAILFSTLFLFVSCEEYLDKVETADITSEDVFKNFESFTGFVETCYIGMIRYHKTGRQAHEVNVGDDVYQSNFSDYSHNGNYWNAFTNSYLFRSDNNYVYPTNTQEHPQSVWGGWLGIRYANIALANLENLENATQEQKDVLEGQAYFFRAHFHWMIMKVWGSVPYVDMVLTPSSDMKLPRLSFHETAEKVLADFEKASALLPENWETHPVGMLTPGQNFGKITKGAVLASMAEVLLYCGSPLMNGVSTGNYEYHVDYCKRAAAKAWEVINYANTTGLHKLQTWGVNGADYKSIFCRMDRNMPRSDEVMLFAVMMFNTRWSFHTMQLARVAQTQHMGSPNATYVERFGMANGLPIDDPASGYNEQNPWVNRDPRFYLNIVFDGNRIIQKNEPSTSVFAQLYVGGVDREVKSSQTGYAYKKYLDISCNIFDNGWAGRWFAAIPHIRLAEIYLMYAEAVNEAYGPSGKDPNADITAIQAVNIVRTRAAVPAVDSKYTTTALDFREIIRDERAVELAFEAKRWYDIRRWYVAHLPEHKEIYALDFDQGRKNFRKTLIHTRIFDMKHYWFPFQVDDVSIYDGWTQNPGW